MPGLSSLQSRDYSYDDSDVDTKKSRFFFFKRVKSRAKASAGNVNAVISIKLSDYMWYFVIPHNRLTVIVIHSTQITRVNNTLSLPPDVNDFISYVNNYR